MSTFSETQWFQVMHCGTEGCGVTFAMSQEYYEARQRDGKSWHCPNGHRRHFAQTTEQKLRKELEASQRETEQARQETGQVRERVAQISRSYNRVRTRIRNGVCPCCNRTFQNLANHMRTEHADYGETKTLRALRIAFGLTQAQLAAEAGVSAPYVSLYERGTDLPKLAANRLNEWVEKQKATA